MDPALTGSAIKAATSAVDDLSKSNARLLERALGPTADVIGQWLAGRAEARLNNTRKVLERTAIKSDHQGRTGPSNPRVAKTVLEESSYTDDEFMAEYFSGLLAASRTPDGRDDSAIFWTRAVAGLSSIQIRLHFQLYRRWALDLRGRSDINLGMDDGRRRAMLHMPLAVAYQAVDPTSLSVHTDGTIGVSAEGDSRFRHAVVGLVREGLIGPEYGFGDSSEFPHLKSPFEQFFYTKPTVAGIELFGYVAGVPATAPNILCQIDPIPDLPDGITEISIAALPNLDPEPPMAEG